MRIRMRSIGSFVGTVGFVVFVVVSTVWLKNCNEESKCASLTAQGVQAVVSSGMVTKECVVLQRDFKVNF